MPVPPQAVVHKESTCKELQEQNAKLLNLTRQRSEAASGLQSQLENLRSARGASQQVRRGRGTLMAGARHGCGLIQRT